MTRFTAEETQVIVHVMLPLFLSESAVFPELGCEGRGRFGVLAVVEWEEFPEVLELGRFLLPGFRLVKAGVLPLSLGLAKVLLAGVSQVISLWHSQ